MAEPETHAVSALVRLRSQLAGELTVAEKRLAQLQADLMHVDATIRLLSDRVEPEAIPATRPIRRSPWFKPGEPTRLALDILREVDKPLTTLEIAALIMERRRLNPEDAVTRQAVRRCLNNLLPANRLFQGEVWRGKEKRWRLAK